MGSIKFGLEIRLVYHNFFVTYVSNFTHNQNLQNKSNFCVYFKRKLLQFQHQGFSFTFDLKRELETSSFLVLATKLFHVNGTRIDIQNFLFGSQCFGLL